MAEKVKVQTQSVEVFKTVIVQIEVNVELQKCTNMGQITYFKSLWQRWETPTFAQVQLKDKSGFILYVPTVIKFNEKTKTNNA